MVATLLDAENEKFDEAAMIENYLVSWAIGYGYSCSGGNAKNIPTDEILSILYKIKLLNGSLSIDPFYMHHEKSKELEICIHGENYLITLLDCDDEGETFVRSYTNSLAVGGVIEIFGDEWDSKMICNDFNLIIAMLKQFMEIGDVSTELLN